MLTSFTDLQVFLGVPSIDEARATLLLELAEDECLTIVDPLPVNARRVVLSSAARAYTNPEGVASEGTGPFQVSRPWPGLYLTKAERAALERAGGLGGAYSVDPTAADAGPLGSWSQVGYSPLDATDHDPAFDYETTPLP